MNGLTMEIGPFWLSILSIVESDFMHCTVHTTRLHFATPMTMNIKCHLHCFLFFLKWLALEYVTVLLLLLLPLLMMMTPAAQPINRCTTFIVTSFYNKHN